ncbi:MAG: Dabb family protein [Acidimicrobiales bacterium]|nr:Dabb family protein [Acidimicrobiales bacterium]
MLTHVVLITVADGTAEERVDALVAGLRALPDRIDAIDTYRVGRDLGLADGNATVGIIATFASPEALRTYVDHPDHRAVVDDLIRPISTGVTRLQMDGDARPA